MATKHELLTPFSDAVPPLSTAEKDQLERSIVAAGRVLYPVLVTTLHEIMDGHNRYEIAERLCLPYDIKVLDESANWDEDRKRFEVQSIALAQRNLSPDQKRELNKVRDKQITAKRKEGWTQKRIAEWFRITKMRVSQVCADAEPNKTALLGSQFRCHCGETFDIQVWHCPICAHHWPMSRDDCHNCHKASRPRKPTGRTEKLTGKPGSVRNPSTDQRVKINPASKPAIANRVESGEPIKQVAADLGVTPQAVKKIVTAEKKVAEIKAAREESAKQRTSNCGVITGDFRVFGAGLEDDSIDLIFTDPPYDNASVDLYSELAQLASRVLTPGGWLLSYSGMSQFDETLAALCGGELRYAWTFCVLHSGGDLRFRKLRLQSGWKPIVGLYRPPLQVDWEWFKDVVSGGKQKSLHEWQQAEAEAAHFISRLCPANGLVCDPFCGSGTTLAAAKSLGRKWIGCEVDEDHAETARSRLA